MRWAVGWPFTLLAGPEENSSDWGQSPGEVEERPPPHPCPGLSAQDQGREEGWKVGPHALAPRPLWAPVC